MMRTSPLRGWHDCFLSSDPRVETRGYSPVPLRGSPSADASHDARTVSRHVSHEVAQSCSRGFQPAGR